MWKDMGVLPENFYPGCAENLMILCASCRAAYDHDFPAWLAIPQDLNYFIEFEHADYEARVEAAANGVRQRRTMPEVPLLLDGMTPNMIKRAQLIFLSFSECVFFSLSRMTMYVDITDFDRGRLRLR